MVDNSVEQLLSKALAEKGLQIEISNNLKMAYSITIDTSVHDKQIRAEAVDECIKVFRNIPRHYYRDELLNELEQLKEHRNE